MAHRFIADGMRVGLRLVSTDAGTARHIFHVKNPGGAPAHADCQAVADAIKDWWNSDYRNMVNGTWRAMLAVAYGVNAVPAAIARTVIDTPGVRSGDSLPNNVACEVEFGTHSTGRTRHGGARALGMVATDTLGDRFTPAYLTAIAGVFSNLNIRLGLLGYPLAIASYVDQQVYPVREVFVNGNVVGSQKTRRAEHGE